MSRNNNKHISTLWGGFATAIVFLIATLIYGIIQGWDVGVLLTSPYPWVLLGLLIPLGAVKLAYRDEQSKIWQFIVKYKVRETLNVVYATGLLLFFILQIVLR